MKLRPTLRSIGAFALAALFVQLAGCGAGGSSGAKAPLPRQGSVRVVNALTDSGSMSSFLSSSVFAVNQYGDSTDLRQVLVGQYVMNILLTPPDDVNVPLVANEQLNLTDPDEVSFYLIGTTSSPQEVRIHNQAISFDVNLNNAAAFPPPDYQILHAAVTSVAAADVYVTDANADITTMSPTATLNFGEHTDLAQLDPAVTYRVQVTDAGSKTVLYDSGDFTQAKLQRSVYMLMDNYGSDGVSLRVANITATGATNFANETLQGTWRVTNEMPDALAADGVTRAIDVYIGDPTTGTPVFANVEYGETTTPYQPVANGTVTINVTRAGVPGTTIAAKSLTFVGGQALGLYATGLVASGTLDAFVESQRPITGQSQVRFVDAAPSAGTIDVYLLIPGQNVGDVSPVVASGALLSSTELSLTPGSYDIAVTRASTTVQLFGPDRIVVDAGGVYSAVLVEAAGGGPPLTLQFTQEALPPP